MEGQQNKFKKYNYIFWGIFSLGFIIVLGLFFLIANGKLGVMPTFSELENPKTIMNPRENIPQKI